MTKLSHAAQAFEGLEPQMAGFLRAAGIIGAHVSLLDTEGQMAQFSFGSADRDIPLPPDGETLFMIGSCSKAFAALAILLLCQDGRVALDDPIARYVPFKLDRPENPVTIRHILTHTSGIPNLGMGEVLIARLRGESGGDWFDSMARFYAHLNAAGGHLVFSPGERYIYCNSNYTLAAGIVSAVTGGRYEDFVAERIFRPLGMGRSCFDRADYEGFDNKSRQYFPDGERCDAYFEPVIAGCGGIISCTRDLGYFLRMLINGGTLNGVAFLRPDLVREMLAGHTPMTTARDLLGPGFGPEKYALGFMEYADFSGARVVTHSGSTGIGSANLFMLPELDLALASACSTPAGESILPVVGFMMTCVLAGRDFFAEVPYFATEAHMQALCGRYGTYCDIVQSDIRYEDGLLWITPLDRNENSPKRASPLIPDDPGEPFPLRFRQYTGPQAYRMATFFSTEDGEERLILERNLYTKKK